MYDRVARLAIFEHQDQLGAPYVSSLHRAAARQRQRQKFSLSKSLSFIFAHLITDAGAFSMIHRTSEFCIGSHRN
jgi:hypothetical protein